MPWAPVYADRDALAEFLRIDDAEDDEQLTRALETASRAVDEWAHRQFGQTAEPEPRRFTLRWGRRSGWVAGIDDVQDLTGLVVKLDTARDRTFATTVPAEDLELLPVNSVAQGRPVEAMRVTLGGVQGFPGELQVTARWGWSAVPAAVVHATLLQASRLVARRDSPYGIAGSPEAGSEMRLLARVDPDVAVSLQPYRRRIWTA